MIIEQGSIVDIHVAVVDINFYISPIRIRHNWVIIIRNRQRTAGRNLYRQFVKTLCVTSILKINDTLSFINRTSQCNKFTKAGFIYCRLILGQRDSRQDADNQHHHQKLNERKTAKTAFYGVFFVCVSFLIHFAHTKNVSKKKNNASPSRIASLRPCFSLLNLIK